MPKLKVEKDDWRLPKWEHEYIANMPQKIDWAKAERMVVPGWAEARLKHLDKSPIERMAILDKKLARQFNKFMATLKPQKDLVARLHAKRMAELEHEYPEHVMTFERQAYWFWRGRLLDAMRQKLIGHRKWWQKPEHPRRIFMRNWWKRIISEVYHVKRLEYEPVSDKKRRLMDLRDAAQRLNQTWAVKVLDEKIANEN